MIQVACNGNCHIDSACHYHNPQPVTFTTNSTAQKCPVCEANGQILNINGGFQKDSVEICHGCGGKGWVIV